MRYAIISDIHGNYAALKEVVRDIKTRKIDHTISLGDVVGYGPQPHECIALLRSNKIISVLGNHDAGVIGEANLWQWRREALITWSDARKKLTNEDITWLRRNPYYFVTDDFMCVHGTPKQPTVEYMHDKHIAYSNLNYMMRNICFVGHTHVPKVLMKANGQDTFINRPLYTLMNVSPSKMYFINPGSVGQPRDLDSRASYIVYDTQLKTIILRRVAYNIQKTQRLILSRNYPPMLANRLSGGW